MKTVRFGGTVDIRVPTDREAWKQFGLGLAYSRMGWVDDFDGPTEYAETGDHHYQTMMNVDFAVDDKADEGLIHSAQMGMDLRVAREVVRDETGVDTGDGPVAAVLKVDRDKVFIECDNGRVITVNVDDTTEATVTKLGKALAASHPSDGIRLSLLDALAHRITNGTVFQDVNAEDQQRYQQGLAQVETQTGSPAKSDSGLSLS